MYQRGMVLVGVLIVLIILSVMAVSLGKFSIGTQQIASSNTSHLYSASVAENGVRYAEYIIFNQPNLLIVGASGAKATNQLADDNWWATDSNWTCASCAAKTESETIGGGNVNYHIEKMTKVYINMEADQEHGIVYYRVLSKASNAGATASMLMAYSGLFE
jgi:Tfp pilus assembly protein PilX